MILGVDEAISKLKVILESVQAKPIDSTTLEELKTFFKHLAFVACAGKSPIRKKWMMKPLPELPRQGVLRTLQGGPGGLQLSLVSWS